MPNRFGQEKQDDLTDIGNLGRYFLLGSEMNTITLISPCPANRLRANPAGEGTAEKLRFSVPSLRSAAPHLRRYRFQSVILNLRHDLSSLLVAGGKGKLGRKDCLWKTDQFLLVLIFSEFPRECNIPNPNPSRGLTKLR